MWNFKNYENNYEKKAQWPMSKLNLGATYVNKLGELISKYQIKLIGFKFRYDSWHYLFIIIS